MHARRIAYTAVLVYCFTGILSITTTAQSIDEGLVSLEHGQYEAAQRIFDMHAHAGDAFAQSRVGYMYHLGFVGEVDHKQARIWYEKAAAQGEARAQNNWAMLLDWDDTDDCEQAYELLRAAAQQELSEAYINIGQLLTDGVCFEHPAYGLALIFYRDAAQAGHPVAQFRLGSFYYNGTGVPADTLAAATWWRMAAQQGHNAAQRGLSNLYYQEGGLPAEDWYAYMWLQAALMNNTDLRTSEEVQTRQRALRARLSARELEVAHREAQAMQP